MSKLWQELKRRNVVRVGLAYVLVAWVALQVADFALEVIEAPSWALQGLVLIAAIGLPIVLVFAWVYEMTPEGIKRESEVIRTHSITGHTGRKLNTVIIVVLVLAVVTLMTRQFLISPNTQPPESPTAASEAASGETPRSIAVLPFDDFSEAGDQDYFSKGIAEEILNLLARTDGLRVAARTSSFAIADTGADIRDIGNKLDVGAVLEGSIRKSGDTIRVTAQLINVADGYHIWSDTYDREFADIFRIQDEISGSIMAALRVHLLGEAPATAVPERTSNMEAYSAYLIGRERMALRTGDDLAAAREQFERAVELDPQFAPARVQLAHAWLLSEQEQFGGRDLEREDVDAIVEPQLARALALAPDSAEAIAVAGYFDLRRHRYEDAREAFDRAIAINPNDAQVYAWRAEIAYLDERYEDMLADKEKAYLLDPMSLQISADLAREYSNFWRPEDAQRVVDRMFDLHPDHPLAYQSAIVNLAIHGRLGEAMLMLDQAIERHPDNEMFLRYRAFGLNWIGLYDEAKSSGNDEARFEGLFLTGEFEAARELLESHLDGPDADDWYGWGRWLYASVDMERGRERLRDVVGLEMDALDEENVPWRDECRLYLVHDLRLIGQDQLAGDIMENCRKQVEERYKARYLCPCSLYSTVLFAILDGQREEALERAGHWLANGDQSAYLPVDPVFAALSDSPEYEALLARNATQLEQQQATYLARRSQ